MDQTTEPAPEELAYPPPVPAPAAIEGLPVKQDPWTQNPDGRMLIEMVPPAVQKAISEAYRLRHDLFNLDETELKAKLREMRMSPVETDNCLRVKFWHEYERAHQDGTKMVMSAVYSTICPSEYFYNVYLGRPEKLAWILTPPMEYETRLKALILLSTSQLNEILELPNRDEKGRVNVKILELKAKIHFQLEQRIHGAVVQRLEQKTQTLNIHTTDKAVAKMAAANTMEDIQRRMKELEARERRMLQDTGQRGEVIVEPAPEGEPPPG